jgi:hypothetical protein
VQGQARGVAQGQDLEARREGDRLRGEAQSAPDPQAELRRREQLELNERDAALGKARGIEDKGAEARTIAGDPRAAATVRAEGAASAEVRDRAPIDPNQAESEVRSTTAAATDPKGVASARADAEVAAKQRDVEAKVDVTGNVSGSATIKPDPEKK